MPFVLTNALATFKCAMDSILAPFLRKFVMVFIDDILVFSSTWEDHLAHIKMVLQTLRDHQFFLKRSKCVFGRNELIYLGHIISHKGVTIDPNKRTTTEKWLVPQLVTELRGCHRS